MWGDNIGDLLPGLLPGLYRGITYHVPDTSSVAGRRAAEYLFPGVDPAAYDDFGLFPGEVTIDGLIVGDDYIAQGKALQAAFETPGPATLVHPWLGPMTVILLEPGQISFSDRELRVVRFSVTFKRLSAGGGSSAISSLTGLTTAIAGLVSAASSLAAAVGSRVISATRQKSAARSHRVVSTAITALSSPRGAGRTVARLRDALPSVSANPAAFDAMMVSVSERLSAVTLAPSVAPAAGAVIETQPPSSVLVSIGQALAATLLPEIIAAPSDADAALLISATARVIAATSAQAVHIDYDSRVAAVTYRSAAVGQLDSLIEAVDVLSDGILSAEGTAVRRVLRDLQSAITVDVNETLGRLPSVRIFEPGRPIDAFQLAAHIAGDTPSNIETVYLDIISRNRPRHPAFIDAIRIEVKL